MSLILNEEYLEKLRAERIKSYLNMITKKKKVTKEKKVIVKKEKTPRKKKSAISAISDEALFIALEQLGISVEQKLLNTSEKE